MEVANLAKKEGLKKAGLFAITWPIFIEFFLHMFMGSADTFMLSKVSDEAVASVGVANQILFFCIILFGFVATGTSVVIAQYLGARKVVQATQISALAISLNIVLGLLVSGLMVVSSTFLLKMMNLPLDLIGDAKIYLQIVGGSLFIQAVLVTVGAIIRTNGFTRDAMYVSIGMNIINVIGNYLVIFGPLGIPQLGVTGVAVVTALSRSFGMIVLFVLLYRRLQVRIEWSFYFKWSLSYVRKILGIGLPASIDQLSYQVSQMLITFFITFIGVTAIATRMYTMNIMLFIMLIGIAIGQGTQIIVGHYIGAKKVGDAYKQLISSLRWSLLFTMVTVALFALLREQLLSIFTHDPSIIQLGSILLLLCLILEPGRVFNLVVANSLRAAGDVKIPLLISLASIWGICVPLAYLLGIHFGLGLIGMWIAYIIDEWTRGLCMYARWKSRAWEKKSLVDSDGEEQGATL